MIGRIGHLFLKSAFPNTERARGAREFNGLATMIPTLQTGSID